VTIKEEMFKQKSERLITKLIGKTIVKVEPLGADYPSQDEIGSLVLYFTDGTKQVIEAYGDGGCYECDPDGINCHWLIT